MRSESRFLAVCLLSTSLFSVASAEETPANKNANNAKRKQQLFTISKKTTYLQEPLTEGGFVNYVKAIDDEFRTAVTPENNFAVVFWQTVGPAEIDRPLRKRFFEKLGIETVPDEGDYYVTLHQMRKRQQKRNPRSKSDIFEQQGRAAEGPWSATESPELAEWLRINDKHLDRLARATKRKRFYSPTPMADDNNPPPVIAMLLPAIQGLRDIARGLQARAMLRLNSGDVEGAWNDLLSCHRLARLAGQNPTLIGSLVAIAIDAIAYQGDAHLAQHRGMTAPQALRYQQDLRKLPEIPSMVENIDRTERFVLLDSVAVFARGDLNDLDPGLFFDGPADKTVVKILASGLIDWNTVLEMGNDWYDRQVEATKQPTFAQRKLAFAELNQEIKKIQTEIGDLKTFAKSFFALPSPRQTMSKHVGGIIIVLLTPGIEQAKEAENRSSMRVRLFDVVFALSAFRAENGRYPTRLEALAPKYLAKLPRDLYSDANLQYRTTGKDYLLYSVGQNQRDDGGQTFGSRPPGDDIVVSTRPPKKTNE